jgi:hypothetical protein
MNSFANMAHASCLGAGVEEFAKELVVLLRLRHEHIVTFYGIYQHFHVEDGGTVSDRCALGRSCLAAAAHNGVLSESLKSLWSGYCCC